MAKAGEIIAFIRTLAPEKDSMAFDNVGLMTGSESAETSKVLLCLDVMTDTIAEAAEMGARLVISHHPLIFHPPGSLADDNFAARRIVAAIRAGLTVYSAHTNLDYCAGGINDFAAEKLGLTDIRPLEIADGIAVGRVGELPRPVTAEDLAALVSRAYDDPAVMLACRGGEKIRRVAVINGSGGDDRGLRLTTAAGADALVTSEVKHHVAIAAREEGIVVVEVSHYSGERIYLSRLKGILDEKIGAAGLNAEVVVSRRETRPLSPVK